MRTVYVYVSYSRDVDRQDGPMEPETRSARRRWAPGCRARKNRTRNARRSPTLIGGGARRATSRFFRRRRRRPFERAGVRRRRRRRPCGRVTLALGPFFFSFLALAARPLDDDDDPFATAADENRFCLGPTRFPFFL